MVLRIALKRKSRVPYDLPRPQSASCGFFYAQAKRAIHVGPDRRRDFCRYPLAFCVMVEYTVRTDTHTNTVRKDKMARRKSLAREQVASVGEAVAKMRAQADKHLSDLYTPAQRQDWAERTALSYIARGIIVVVSA